MGKNTIRKHNLILFLDFLKCERTYRIPFNSISKRIAKLKENLPEFKNMLNTINISRKKIFTFRTYTRLFKIGTRSIISYTGKDVNKLSKKKRERKLKLNSNTIVLY